MNLGIDIDNVITAFDNGLLKEFLIQDKLKRNSGIVNPKADHITKGMFDWSEDEVHEFYANHMERIAKGLSPRRNCKKYMDKLLADGHKLILISHRAYPDYKEPEKTTIEWLKKHKINYTKLVISKSADKTEECRQNNIDIMIDDRAGQCQKMSANGINCILMLTKHNRNRKGNLSFATSWKNLYEEITKWKK